MNLQTLLNSKQAGKLALFLSRRIPLSAGYRLAAFAAARIAANPQTPLVQAIRANQWAVSGGTLSAGELEEIVPESLGYVARAFFELFRYLDDPAALENLVVFGPEALDLLHRGSQAGRGVVVCGVHMSGFDLVMRAAALTGAHLFGLSLPEANEAVEWQHEMRRQVGMEILPASIGNLRQAVHRLAKGEMVITGIDYPRPGLKYQPLFFGRPAQLPTHHVYLAQKACVPIVLLASVLEEDGRYHVYSSGYIEMTPGDDREKEMVHNAEKVLQAAEALIRRAPHQWTIFQPVWPDVLENLA
jgi:phosphatidylinositol dimannoside acyltransferase